jgi:uncharacterized protein (DUF111 family)
LRLIEGAGMAPGTAEQAVAVLTRLAEAESRVHGVPLAAVHFHEIADWDSLMDVVAAGSIAAALRGCTFSVSALPRGQGLVRTQHGLLAVPAPATVEILKGFRWRDDGIAGERVTPTGAAILAHLVADPASEAGSGILAAVGTGAGTRNLPGMPNVLRALVFTRQDEARDVGEASEVVVLSFDVDDMTGEEIGVAADRLRQAEGVLDLSIGTRQGKKGRPLSDFRLLVEPAFLRPVSRLCFLETSTIGLRWRREARACLVRGADYLSVAGQTLRCKRSRRPGGRISTKVESDDVAAIAGLIDRRRLTRLVEQEQEEKNS